jgi:16S rRNA processing protein RimM
MTTNITKQTKQDDSKTESSRFVKSLDFSTQKVKNLQLNTITKDQNLVKNKNQIEQEKDTKIEDQNQYTKSKSTKEEFFDNIEYSKESPDMIIFAKIVGVHGIRGAFTADSFFEFPEKFINENKVYFYNKKIPLKIEGKKKDRVILSTPFVDSVDKARSMVGKFLKCYKSDIPKPQREGEYTVAHLIGLKAYYAGSSVCFGTVVGLTNNLSSVILEIEIENKQTNVTKKEYILFNNTYVGEINLEQNFIIINKVESINGDEI